jgi:hypothetical protein
MDEKTKATLTNLDTWKRGLFMVVFVITSGVAKFIVILLAIFQFITVLFKGQANQGLLPFGQNLSTYLYQISLFLTFKSQRMPFPFSAFPDGTPATELNEDNNEDMPTAETKTNTDEEMVEPESADIKTDVGEAEVDKAKDTKNEPSKE